jgi:hypothetical protein
MMGFKEILWDSGGVWFVVLAMTIGFVLNQLRYIMSYKEKL